MAFDGITIAAVTKELRDNLLNNRITKIAQPEVDELILTIKGNSSQYRLLMSADASLPLIYLTDTNKTSPMNAPAFCMLLRKHLQNARIVDITQPHMERVIVMELEHLDEMGDLCRKKLILEIMGKHSNLIFCNQEGVILDSIKHVSGMMSSVREVLPGREYFIPKTQEKQNPMTMTAESLADDAKVAAQGQEIFKFLFSHYTGISPVIAQEICYRAEVDSDSPLSCQSEDTLFKVGNVMYDMMQQVKKGDFAPCVYYENGVPKEYSMLKLELYRDAESTSYDTVSKLLSSYYEEKNQITRIRQRSVDLRKIVSLALERNIKKLDLQQKQLEDAEKREKYKLYGELLNAYGYSMEEGRKEAELLNYYTNEMTKVPLDETLSAHDNAKKYFDKYNKMKRTAEALGKFAKETEEEINHLESVATSLDIALREEDLLEIKQELTDSGYIRRKGNARKEKVTSKPFHYKSSDGYDIYVGKNNYQNEDLTFKFATGNDWWFHAKKIPGSHVIVKCGNEELPDRTFEEAASLAAYYSKGKEQDKVEVDYTRKKNVKKPAGAKPGFVVYYTNYSMLADTNIHNIIQV